MKRIEELLSKTNRNLSDLPGDLVNRYQPEQNAEYLRSALKACGLYTSDDGVTFGEAVVSACCYGLYQKDVIERLADALEDTLRKYKKATYRLNTWGDIHFVSDLEKD